MTASERSLVVKTPPTLPIKQRRKKDGERPQGDECLVVLHGEALGRRYALTTDDVIIGRDLGADVILDAQHVSRQHARVYLREEGDGRGLEDLGSTNGTYLNDEPVTDRPLQSGDLIQVGEVIFKYLAGDDLEAAYHEEIYQMAITDGLTSIPNGRYLKEFLDREVARVRRHQRALSVLFLDIDHFKKVNTDLGHVGGDLVLRDFAQLLSVRIRRDELMARYGGEEFVIVLPEADLEGACRYAEILRQRVEAHEFVFDGRRVPITVSVGVATWDHELMHTAQDLIREADDKLREAKAAGRNRVAS